MLYVNNISIKLEKKKEKNIFAGPVSPSGDLLWSWQAVLPSQPHPTFPLCVAGARPPQNWPLCVGDTEEQLSCINEKNARVFNLSKLFKAF